MNSKSPKSIYQQIRNMKIVSPIYPKGCNAAGIPLSVRIPRDVKKMATGCNNRILKIQSIDLFAKSLLKSGTNRTAIIEQRTATA